MRRPCPTAEAAEKAFYAAMAAADLDGMMSLWADDDAIVCNHPGGPRLIGMNAIRASFKDIFSHGGVTIATSEVQAFRTAEVAVHSLIERISVEGRGGSEVVEVIVTNVFVRTAGEWRILVHHAGVFEGNDDADADDDESADSLQLSIWGTGLPMGERTDDSDDEGSSDPEPRRPPPGRLH
jgi:uncharacterized protein (TIGR02246 family)